MTRGAAVRARTGDRDHVEPAAPAVLADLEERLDVGRLVDLREKWWGGDGTYGPRVSFRDVGRLGEMQQRRPATSISPKELAVPRTSVQLPGFSPVNCSRAGSTLTRMSVTGSPTPHTRMICCCAKIYQQCQ